MTTQLASLRTRLQSLRRRRSIVRLGTAGSAWLLSGLGALIAAFLVDWLFEMNRPQRLVSLLLCLTAAAWAFKRFVGPALGVRESEVDMALWVERQHEVDSDLVAAIQFESAATGRWASPQLRTAVVDRVKQFSDGIDVFAGFSVRPLLRRISVLIVTLAVVLAAVANFPAHAAAFWNRFWLGAAEYPTRTIIEQVIVNGRPVVPDRNSRVAIREVYGKPLVFEVGCSGEIPATGSVRITDRTRRQHALVELSPTGPAAFEEIANAQAESNSTVRFGGELSRLADPVIFQIELGDARSAPVEVQVIPQPAVTIDLFPRPPDYAAPSERTPSDLSGRRRLAVLEGSRIDVHVRCTNKRLEWATLHIDDETHRLVSADDTGRNWTLSGGSTQFSDIRRSVRYEVRVEDEDGLGLEPPLRGVIQIKTDRPPRVAAGMITRLVLPTAAPRLSYGAVDDYGLSQLRVVLEVKRGDGRVEQHYREVAVIPAEQQPQTELRGEYAVDLASLNLNKDDEVRVSLEAFDYRGSSSPESRATEPIGLTVTDRAGILRELREADEQSAQQLDDIILRELGIGESR
jgi:hypothetical protein